MGSKPAKNKRRIGLKVFLTLFILSVLSACIVGYNYYQKIYGPNVNLSSSQDAYLHIPSEATIDTVNNILLKSGFIDDFSSYEWCAERKNLKNHVHPGRYVITDGMNNNDLINLLRSGEQEPLNVIINSTRTIDRMAGVAAKYLEADSLEILQLIQNKDFIKEKGFDSQTIIGMFIPNTYEFYWNTSAEDYFERMKKEYDKFWNESRRAKAKKIGLTQNEVSTLASIVELETQKSDERAKVAGVYINRIRKGMLLQADPTVIFAVGDFTIKRVLTRHLEIDSPYNTYKYKGLPPGPITMPSVTSIDGVLNYENHDYIFFCAKEDFSGYHNFAKTLREHNLNAARYRKELNRKRILK